MKNLKKTITFALFLLVGGGVLMSAYPKKDESIPVIKSCNSCNDELQAVITKITSKAEQKNGVLVEETYFADVEPNSSEKRKTIWQGGYSYCGGKCFAVVTVTANCFLGYCWGYQASSNGDENCPCGVLIGD
ncbi:MAG: hypothetical protein SFU27_03695 [Thermonemataceae bacterium]|nr:hypothetical protein [Thermonemataceae bacterium]